VKKHKIDCRFLTESPMGDYCTANSDMCDEIAEWNCTENVIFEKLAELQDLIDELAFLLDGTNDLDDEIFETMGSYVSVMRDGLR